MAKLALPKDFALSCVGETMAVSATMESTADLDAVVFTLNHMRGTLSSRRCAVAADFGLPEPPTPSFADQCAEFLGMSPTPEAAGDA